MNITIPRANLLALLTNAVPVSDKKSAMPILATVHIEAADDVLTVSATDLLVSYRGRRPCTVAAPGSACVDGAFLAAVVGKLPDGDVRIAVAKNYTLALTSVTGKRKASLIGMPGEDFPTLPEPGDKHWDIPASALAAIHHQTRYAMSTDATRPHLAATLVEYKAGRLRAVTTDGHRIVIADRVIGDVGAPFTALVPRSAWERAKLPETGTVRLGLANQNTGPIFFSIAEDSDAWASKLVAAAFPSYDQVIPSGSNRNARVNRADFVDALRAVSLAASDRTSGVKLTIANGAIGLHSENPDRGDMDDSVDADLTGPDLTIGFNSKYLIEALSALDSTEVLMEFSGELDPGVVRPVRDASEGDGFTCVIMPMRV